MGHRSHGFPYAQPERHDELRPGEPAPAQVEAGDERRANGTFAQGASTAQRLGGKAHKGTTHLSHRISGLGDDAKRVRTLLRQLRAEVARDYGGGECSALVTAMLKLGAQAMLFADRALAAGNAEEHRKHAESARMHLIYARETAALAAPHVAQRRDAEAMQDLAKTLTRTGDT